MADNTTKMSYQGIVSVKLKINGKLYDVTSHNEGLNYLKYIFALLMTGNSLGSAYTPEYIDLRKVYIEDGVEIERSYFNYFSPLSAKRYYSDGGDWVAELTTVISYEQLLDTVLPDDTSQYYLYLMTGYDTENSVERQHDLAKLAITPKTLSQITPGITASLVWSLQLVNVSEG